MIRIDDVQEAIAECEGVRNPNSSTCLKLAALYTILDHKQTKEEIIPMPTYSYATEPPETSARITYQSDTEFGRIIQGQTAERVCQVMDELMTTLQGMIPRLYEGVIIKLQK